MGHENYAEFRRLIDRWKKDCELGFAPDDDYNGILVGRTKACINQLERLVNALEELEDLRGVYGI